MNLILVRTNSSLVCEMNLYDECLFDFLVLFFSFSLSLSCFYSLETWRIDLSSGISTSPRQQCLFACHEKWTDHVGSYATRLWNSYWCLILDDGAALQDGLSLSGTLGCARKRPQVLQNVDACESRATDVALWHTLFREQWIKQCSTRHFLQLERVVQQIISTF